MDTNQHEIFLQLVRLGIGNEPVSGTKFQVSGSLSAEEWEALVALASEQGLLGAVADGINTAQGEGRMAHGSMPKPVMLQMIGQMLQMELMCAVQEHAAAQMAQLLHEHGIRTYVLKGAVVAECYPRPEHRRSVDMDCFLVNDNDNDNHNDNEDVWERGNRVLEEQGFEVRRDFYKNSTVVLPGLTVENHRYLTPFRGNGRLKSLERLLQGMIVNDNLNDNEKGASERRFEGTWLYRPPVMVSALFLIEHAYSHFLHEGLTWRLVLDWQMFLRRHRDEIDWKV